MSSVELKNVRRTYKCADIKVARIRLWQGATQGLLGPQPNGISLKGISPAKPAHLASPPESAREFITLAKLMEDAPGPIERERAIKIIILACEHLSKRSAAHANLTPASFYWHQGDKDDEVMLAEPKEAAAGAFSVYAAPELLEGKEANALADVYSLGVILYEMISNKSGSAAQLDAFAKELSKWLAYSPIWGITPSALKLIIRRCLNDEPCLRFRDVDELKQALQNFLHPRRAVCAKSNVFGNTPAVLILFLAIVCIYQFYSTPAPGPVAYQSLVGRAPLPAAAPAPFGEAVAGNSLKHSRVKPLSPSEIGILARYEVAILLDRCGSMNEFDCPLSGVITSRWDWATRQLESFAKQTASCFPDGFTLVTFSQDVRRFDHCHENQLAQVCRSEVPSGGTQLAKALELALQNRREPAKPLAVIVVTDGMPNDQAELEKTIANAINTKSKKDLCLLFLTVGSAPAGDRFLGMLDRLPTSHTNNAAISTMKFQKLARIGLGHALVQTVEAENSRSN